MDGRVFPLGQMLQAHPNHMVSCGLLMNGYRSRVNIVWIDNQQISSAKLHAHGIDHHGKRPIADIQKLHILMTVKIDAGSHFGIRREKRRKGSILKIEHIMSVFNPRNGIFNIQILHSPSLSNAKYDCSASR